MKFVRWKQYGFTHIVDETREPAEVDEARGYLVGYVGGWTVCGNWWHRTTFNRPDRDRDRILAPSESNDEKRPLCGHCKKYLAKHST